MRFGPLLAVFALLVACSRAPNGQDRVLGATAEGGNVGVSGGGQGSAGTGGSKMSGSGGNAPASAGVGGSAPNDGGGRGGSAGAGGHSGGSGAAGGGTGSNGGSNGSTGGTSSTITYSTSFDANESPLSEGGRWKHDNTWFTKVVTNGGNAIGTEPNPANSGKYEDSYAFLGGMGFPPNQSASAHIHKGAAQGYLEVELLLRVSDTANSTRGYECFLHQNGEYLSVARWKGAPLSAPAQVSYFDILGSANNVTAPKDGDLFEAQIVGNVITVKLAGSTILSVDAAKFDGTVIDSGDPGIGFDAGGSGAETANSTYGFQDFSAKGL